MTELLDTLQRWFVSLPHCATLGFEFIGVEDGKPTLKVNYRDDLVGNGSNGVIHGVITRWWTPPVRCRCSATWTAPRRWHAGFAHRLPEGRHAGPADLLHGGVLLARQIGFTRAVCHHGDPADPIAHGVAIFYARLVQRHPGRRRHRSPVMSAFMQSFWRCASARTMLASSTASPTPG